MTPPGATKASELRCNYWDAAKIKRLEVVDGQALEPKFASVTKLQTRLNL